MNVFATGTKNDYRILTVGIFVTAVLSGILAEHLLYRLSADRVGTVLTEYGKVFVEYQSEKSELIRYLLKTELKKYLVLILISFSIFGIVGNVITLFITIYRYIFLLSAIYRSGVGSGYILCICAVLLCFLFCIPIFLYCIRLSCNSYLYCKNNNTKLCRYTKYQLQTELKIGIIMLLYVALGAVVQGIICTDLLERMFV